MADFTFSMREDVVLRKLTADGDGVGDEKKILQVLSVLRSAEKGKATKADAIKALKALESVELNAEKQIHVAEMCSRQTNEFGQQLAEIDGLIGESFSKMEEAKKELKDARHIRRNRVEYNLLVKMIEDLPSRADTTRRLEELSDELQQQAERQQQLEAKLAERRNHLQAFNIILGNFQKFLEDEERMDAEAVVERMGDGEAEKNGRDTEEEKNDKGNDEEKSGKDVEAISSSSTAISQGDPSTCPSDNNEVS